MKTWTLALVAAASVCAGTAVAQPPAPTDNAALRQQIERRFEVVPLSTGVALVPRSSLSGVRSIELTDSVIAIDGTPVTGPELRDRLGADADVVLRLSYLGPADRRGLFAPDPPSAPPTPEIPAPAVPPSQPDVPAIPPPPPPRPNRLGDQVRIGGSVHVDDDEVVAGDVVAIGGSARVDGEVRGEVVAVGGSVELGPRALVSGDIVVVGGTLERAEGARVMGRIHEVGLGNIDFGDWHWGAWPGGPYPRFGRTLALMSTLGRIAVLCVLAALVILLGREFVERVSLRATAEPLKAGAIGLLAQLLFLPVLIVTILILVVTIVGIPLLLLIPFAILGLAILALLGFTSIAYRVGQWVSARFGWDVSNPYAATVLGVLVVVSPLLIARLVSLGPFGGPFVPVAVALGVIAFVVEYVAWTVGFGAVALARFDRPQTPPLPPVATAPPVLP